MRRGGSFVWVCGKETLDRWFPGTRVAKCHVSRKKMHGQGGREGGRPSAPELLLSPLGSY